MLPVAGVGRVFTTTHATDLTTGTAAEGDTSWLTDIAAGEAAGVDGALGIHIDGTTTTFLAGDVFEIESVDAVHPETKISLGYRKQFVVLENFTGGAEGDLKFKPISGGDAGIVSSGARQNVSAAPANDKKIYKIGAGNVEKLNTSMYFHRDAMAVAFANLTNPTKYGAWGSTEKVDDIVVRIWRDRDVVNSRFPIRLDAFLGCKVVLPQIACRIHADL